jgi:RNA polymerase sigma factor (sigma-70 family)
MMMKVAARYFTNEDDIVDVMNRSFLKILSSLDQLQNCDAYFGWAKQITVRSALDALRAQKSYRESIQLSLDNEHSKVHHTASERSTADARLESNEIFKIIAKLPEVLRAVVNMVLIDGYTHKETAEALGISEGNSRQCLSRARGLLQEQILKHSGITQNIGMRQ